MELRDGGRIRTIGYESETRTLTNWDLDGPITVTYGPPAPGEPPTWMNEGKIRLRLRDGSIRDFPFKVKESETKKTDWVTSVCGTDTFTDDPDGLLATVFAMHRDNPNAFPRRTEEVHRDDSGTFERAYKLADIPVQIVDAKPDAWKQLRYIVQAVNRQSGTSVKLALTADELHDGSWLHGIGEKRPIGPDLRWLSWVNSRRDRRGNGMVTDNLGADTPSPLAGVVATKKQGTRLLKVACGNPLCGVVVRITRKYIDGGKIPTCACGARMEVAVSRGEKI